MYSIYIQFFLRDIVFKMLSHFGGDNRIKNAPDLFSFPLHVMSVVNMLVLNCWLYVDGS